MQRFIVKEQIQIIQVRYYKIWSKNNRKFTFFFQFSVVNHVNSKHYLKFNSKFETGFRCKTIFI